MQAKKISVEEKETEAKTQKANISVLDIVLK